MRGTEIRKMVRERYGEVAARGGSCCDSGGQSCCGSNAAETESRRIGKEIGYTDDELSSAPEESNLGLGCGNPTGIASIKAGEVVLDLGSGAGIDCFLAAQKTGPNGHVIGVDMTTEMVEKARENADRAGYANVEFRLGEIEHLPVADRTADLIISNCVINLSADKQQVFSEASRALKPGGRITVSDIVLLESLPDDIRSSVEAYAGCIAGASKRDEYLRMIGEAGLTDVNIVDEQVFDLDPNDYGMQGESTAASIASITVQATKPTG